MHINMQSAMPNRKRERESSLVLGIDQFRVWCDALNIATKQSVIGFTWNLKKNNNSNIDEIPEMIWTSFSLSTKFQLIWPSTDVRDFIGLLLVEHTFIPFHQY